MRLSSYLVFMVLRSRIHIISSLWDLHVRRQRVARVVFDCAPAYVRVVHMTSIILILYGIFHLLKASIIKT